MESVVLVLRRQGTDRGQVLRKSTNVLPVCESGKNENHFCVGERLHVGQHYFHELRKFRSKQEVS
jgi:hypothetical protein